MATPDRKPAPKHFTVEQANRMLPLVKAIVKDIVELAAEFRSREERLARISMAERGMDEAHKEEVRQMRSDLAKDAARIEELNDELRELGVEFKGWDGLVDFPSIRDGREVYLCWRLGEPEVRYWHELDAGFAGRQPLYEPPVGVGETPETGPTEESLE